MKNGVTIENYRIARGAFSLEAINLKVEEGETFAVLGKTGSGKTMLLESIAGYYRDGSGDIFIDGVSVRRIPVEQRRIGFVYQDYGLFPHMSVFKNIGYGLAMQNLKKPEIKCRVEEIAEAFSISHILQQYPQTLSGGEKQRTAMARALITKPRLLLLDEPFSALDPTTKKMLYGELQRIREAYSCPIIFVTHDFQEAALLADRIGIMEEGRLCAVRTPDTLFASHESPSIREFLGM